MPKKNRLRCIAYKTEERYLHETGRSEYSAILNLLAGVQHKPEKISPMVFLNIFAPRDTTETHNIYSTSKLDNLKEGFRDHFNYYPWIMFEDVSGNAPVYIMQIRERPARFLLLYAYDNLHLQTQQTEQLRFR